MGAAPDLPAWQAAVRVAKPAGPRLVAEAMLFWVLPLQWGNGGARPGWRFSSGVSPRLQNIAREGLARQAADRQTRSGPTSAELKSLVRVRKLPVSPATAWRTDPITPRWSPYPKGHRAIPGGVWRSLTAIGGGRQFMVFAQVQEGRENFKAILAVRQDEEWRVLVRLE